MVLTGSGEERERKREREGERANEWVLVEGVEVKEGGRGVEWVGGSEGAGRERIPDKKGKHGWESLTRWGSLTISIPFIYIFFSTLTENNRGIKSTKISIREERC